MSAKTILVFCDGTGNDGSLSVGEPEIYQAVENAAASEALVPATAPPRFQPRVGGGGDHQNATNVLRLARAVTPFADNNREQLVLYLSGVGSEADFNGEGNVATASLQALGTAVASKIRDAYVFIAQNLQKADSVCIFGFSRGAYTARKLCGLIEAIGLLETQQLGKFFAIWKQLYNGETPDIPPGTRKVDQDFDIPCVGVWDTVGSVRGALDVLNIKDNYLPPCIKVALHAVSLQDNRDKFQPTLWVVPRGGLREGQIFKEIWFPGAHADVGGGYERHELADISLFWMAGEIALHVSSLQVKFDLKFLASIRQPNPDPWGESQPHNTYDLTPWWQKAVIRPQTRLDSGAVTQSSVFHQSITVAPTQLVNPSHMITLNTLQNTWGPQWVATVPDLNPFEQDCRNNWKEEIGEPLQPFERLDDLLDRTFLDSENPAWVQSEVRTVPDDAVHGGWDDDATALYVARAYYRGGLHPGKLSLTRFTGVMIGWGGDEINILEGYDILSADLGSVAWIGVSGPFHIESSLKGAIPVAAGCESDQTPLYIARATMDKGVHCGKVKEGDTAMIPYDHKEVFSDIYQVLVWSDSMGIWLQRAD